jgi:transcription elongation GreA/GreB family factor
MDKRTVIQMVIDQIATDLEGLIASAKATHAEATHEQNKPENKYDTRSLEASYLAQGQSRQIMESESAKLAYETLPIADFVPTAPIDVGALVTLKQRKQEMCYLVGPKAGGIEITHGGTAVTVITPQSPIGQQLMGKKKGESIVLHGEPFRISRVA